jgi:hypothetical protein
MMESASLDVRVKQIVTSVAMRTRERERCTKDGTAYGRLLMTNDLPEEKKKARVAKLQTLAL